MINKAAEFGPSILAWWPDWRGQTAAVIGAGPSVKTAGIEALQGKARVIVVNNSYELAPWADVLYSCDLAWWDLHKGAPKFPGLKLTYEPLATKKYPGLQLIRIPKSAENGLLIDQPGELGSGGASGFQAFNLAVQFGAKRILLIGMDCTLANGPHWHGRHPVPLNNPAESNIVRWRRAFNEASGIVHGLGIDVVNCSPTSTITPYPKLTIPEALARP